jgi:hypothetical protein
MESIEEKESVSSDAEDSQSQSMSLSASATSGEVITTTGADDSQASLNDSFEKYVFASNRCVLVYSFVDCDYNHDVVKRKNKSLVYLNCGVSITRER